MKTFQLILIISSIVYSALADSEPKKQAPICETFGHMVKKYFRNIDDPTKYWACIDLHQPAELLMCPMETLFDESIGECINWNDWSWTEPEQFDEGKSYKPINSEYTEGHDGRPGCKTDIEMNIGNWRNNNDPTKYWRCVTKNQPGVVAFCPDGFGFNQKPYAAKFEVCVLLNDNWEWLPPINPPSLA